MTKKDNKDSSTEIDSKTAIGSTQTNKSVVIKEKKAIVLLNDIFVDDFDLMVKNIEFKKNVLVVTNAKINPKNYEVQCMIDNLDNVENLIGKLRLYRLTHNIDFCGIVGTDEEYGYVFSESLAKEFKLEYHSQKTLNTVSDKYLQARALEKGKVDIPEMRLVDTYADSNNFKFPCVIKPVNGISSIHVYKCNSTNELKEVFVKLDAYRANSAVLSLTHENSTKAKTIVKRKTQTVISKHFILEEYIDGNEYSCDFFVEKENVIVLRVVRKIVNPDYFPFFEGLYLFNPLDAGSEFSTEYLTDVCKKIAKALDIRFGVCMVDFRFDNKKKKIVIIETTTRPGIDDFIELMKRNYGYISMSIALRQIFGKIDIDAMNIPKGNSIIIYMFAPREGILKKFDTTNLEKLKLPNVQEIIKYNAPGSKVSYLGFLKNPPVIGHVILDNIVSKDIEDIINKIKSNVIIELK